MKDRVSNWEIKALIYLIFDPFHAPVYIKNSKETVSRDRIMKNIKSLMEIYVQSGFLAKTKLSS